MIQCKKAYELIPQSCLDSIKDKLLIDSSDVQQFITEEALSKFQNAQIKYIITAFQISQKGTVFEDYFNFTFLSNSRDQYIKEIVDKLNTEVKVFMKRGSVLPTDSNTPDDVKTRVDALLTPNIEMDPFSTLLDDSETKEKTPLKNSNSTNKIMKRGKTDPDEEIDPIVMEIKRRNESEGRCKKSRPIKEVEEESSDSKSIKKKKMKEEEESSSSEESYEPSSESSSSISPKRKKKVTKRRTKKTTKRVSRKSKKNKSSSSSSSSSDSSSYSSDSSSESSTSSSEEDRKKPIKKRATRKRGRKPVKRTSGISSSSSDESSSEEERPIKKSKKVTRKRKQKETSEDTSDEEHEKRNQVDVIERPGKRTLVRRKIKEVSVTDGHCNYFLLKKKKKDAKNALIRKKKLAMEEKENETETSEDDDSK
ncbi:protein FAM133, putative [Entamoeba invadens IP1]|uniref:Protein FAM133, putative n=1 Tax=Entamoeba invadens IP1 TaxID=370355 RepID=A0A0A1U8R7_ENTIV|nr:protein FAM133, putative [Entamoeba invadens IP1]ELP91315.1 protein FAM133, putative [Entamoeba invadens IP1]|eukprot:XP_004258086.1 protein FAM133, putative [Entamoeba invadens IP1]